MLVYCRPLWSRKNSLAAVLAAVSVLFRQTNAVWTCFLLLVSSHIFINWISYFKIASDYHHMKCSEVLPGSCQAIERKICLLESSVRIVLTGCSASALQDSEGTARQKCGSLQAAGRASAALLAGRVMFHCLLHLTTYASSLFLTFWKRHAADSYYLWRVLAIACTTCPSEVQALEPSLTKGWFPHASPSAFLLLADEIDSEDVHSKCCFCGQNKAILLAKLWTLGLVPFCFCLFAIYNKGIVVGDRANHSPQLHLVQPLYFMLFTVSFLPQIFLHPSR